jgi:hypothetical protein
MNHTSSQELELELEQQALPRRIFLFLLNTTRTVRTVRKPFLCVAFTSIPNLQLKIWNRDRKSANKAITHRIYTYLPGFTEYSTHSTQVNNINE